MLLKNRILVSSHEAQTSIKQLASVWKTTTLNPLYSLSSRMNSVPPSSQWAKAYEWVRNRSAAELNSPTTHARQSGAFRFSLSAKQRRRLATVSSRGTELRSALAPHLISAPQAQRSANRSVTSCSYFFLKLLCWLYHLWTRSNNCLIF